MLPRCSMQLNTVHPGTVGSFSCQDIGCTIRKFKSSYYFFQSSNVTLLHLSITRPNPIFSIQFIPPRPLVTEANLPNQSHQKSHWINSINKVIYHIKK